MNRAKPGADWAPGSMVGRYSLLAKIATGGMAEIWLADQAGLQGFTKLIVIKRILESYSKNPEFVSMFLDEARIAAQLNHPNVVQIFDLGEHAGAYYIAMEYLPGENLSAVVRTGIKKGQPLPMTLAARIMSGAAAGLGHAHNKVGGDGKKLGVVHRDVSPQNLIITLDGNVKVVDFGVARAANRATQTTDGHIKGKIAYMSPEQASGTLVEARSDVFGLGVILFEVTTGTRFYESREMPHMIAMLCGANPLPTARERNPEVPEALSKIIDIALSRDPSKRYASGSELHEALEGWLHSQPETVGPGAVETYLKGLFGEQWGKRAEFIESARMGGLTPSGLRKSLKRETDVSMPGNTSPELPIPVVVAPSNKGFLTAVIAAGVALVAVLAGGVWFMQSNRGTTATVVELPPAVVVPEKPAVVWVETEPVGAEVTIDGVVRGAAPVEVVGLKQGEHDVVAKLQGRQSAGRKIMIQGPGERVRLMLTLPAEKQAQRPSSDGPAKRSGKLTLQTTPWTEVFLGSKRLGESPLLEIPLPVGKHTLRLVNAEAGVKTSVEVEIVANKTTVKKLKF
jgi:serine/threonine protein kinase